MATRQKTVRYLVCPTTVVPQTDGDFNSVQVYDATGDAWYDETADANNFTTADVQLYTAVGSAIYFGSDVIFAGWHASASTATSGGSRVVEYWNGSTWTTFAHSIGSASPAPWVMTLDPPTDWATTTVNGVSGLYWVRCRTSGLHTTAGVISSVRRRLVRTITTTIELDSATGRTFKSVHIMLLSTSQASSTNSLLYHWTKAKVGSGSVTACFGITSTMTGGQTPQHGSSTEQANFSTAIDVTSQFTTSFTGTSHSVEISFVDTITKTLDGDIYNYGAFAIITYDYDDTQSTQVKTISIPFEAEAATLSSTPATIDAVTKLTGTGGFIEEASPVIKSAWFEIFFRRSESSTTDGVIGLAINSDAETTFAFDAANLSNAFDGAFILWDKTSTIPTDATITLKASATNALSGLEFFSAILHVTYSCDYASSTRENLTVFFPIAPNMPFLFMSSATTEHQSIQKKIWIAESNPTLKESAICFDVAGINVSHRFGFGSSSAYFTPGNLSAGVPIYMRIDSGASRFTSNGFSLSTGGNTLTLLHRIENNTGEPPTAAMFGAFVVLNYSFDKSSTSKSSFSINGIVNNNTWNGKRYVFPYTDTGTAALSNGSVFYHTNASLASFPETEYFVNSLGWLLFTSGMTHRALPERIHKINGSSYPYTIGATETFLITNGNSTSPMNSTLGFLLWSIPSRISSYDPNEELFSPKETGNYVFSTTSGWVYGYPFYGISCWRFPYIYTISGTVEGYTGDGSGITVKLHSHQYGGRVVAETTTAAGGTYSFKWHDNTTDDLFVETDAGAKVGRSQNFTAS